MDFSDRFWEKVNKAEGCWIWTASKNKYGYGKFGINHKTYGAHRVSWELANGKIPDGQDVLHKCDNPACVNPKHLFLGTQQDNIQDMIDKQRRGYTGLKGAKNTKAKFTEAQVSAIREKYARGATRAELASEYSVNWSTIDRIVKNIRWKA